MHPPILNLNSVELEPLPEAVAPSGETAGCYQQRLARVGQQLGAVTNARSVHDPFWEMM